MSLLDDIQAILNGANGSCDSVYSNTNGVLRKAFKKYDNYAIDLKWRQGVSLFEVQKQYEMTHNPNMDPSVQEFMVEFEKHFVKPPLWNAGIDELEAMMRKACDTGITNAGFGCNKSNRVDRCNDYVDRKIKIIREDKVIWQALVRMAMAEAVKKDWPGLEIRVEDLVGAFISFGANKWVVELAGSAGNLNNLGMPNIGAEGAQDLINQYFYDPNGTTTTGNDNTIKTMGLSMINNPVAVIAGIVFLALLASMLFSDSG